MQADYSDFEVVVSDNSSSDEQKCLNLEAVSPFVGAPNFRIVSPPRLLSPPEHFEFALDFASGDYISYATDKMVMLPNALSRAAAAISASGADIVNWANAPYYVGDSQSPAGPGTLYEEIEFLDGKPTPYDPIEALRFKAASSVRRDLQRTRDYVVGKIIFGCYSRELVNRIRAKSGTLFGGATHDYSAMIQGLSLARGCVMLNCFGILFISLPVDQSLGSLTTTYAQQALRYFRSFSNADAILSSLPVPGLYASVHNMVAHDYKKFLPIYGRMDLFDEGNWLAAIHHELTSQSKVWRDSDEMDEQMERLFDYISQAGQRLPFYSRRVRATLVARYEIWRNSATGQRLERLVGKPPSVIYRNREAASLDEAMRHLVASRT